MVYISIKIGIFLCLSIFICYCIFSYYCIFLCYCLFLCYCIFLCFFPATNKQSPHYGVLINRKGVTRPAWNNSGCLKRWSIWPSALVLTVCTLIQIYKQCKSQNNLTQESAYWTRNICIFFNVRSIFKWRNIWRLHFKSIFCFHTNFM